MPSFMARRRPNGAQRIARKRGGAAGSGGSGCYKRAERFGLQRGQPRTAGQRSHERLGRQGRVCNVVGGFGRERCAMGGRESVSGGASRARGDSAAVCIEPDCMASLCTMVERRCCGRDTVTIVCVCVAGWRSGARVSCLSARLSVGCRQGQGWSRQLLWQPFADTRHQ